MDAVCMSHSVYSHPALSQPSPTVVCSACRDAIPCMLAISMRLQRGRLNPEYDLSLILSKLYVGFGSATGLDLWLIGMDLFWCLLQCTT